jgi:phospholipase/lecithinase/hemolysin
MRRLHQALLFVALIQINLNVFAYSQLVIFGDSLSDTGNHPAALLGLPYPYYQNRISNGPVAVDVLAKALGLSAANSGHLFENGNGSNYSVSGANAVGNDPQDLSEQIEAFINRSPATLGRQALYLIMIGGNDVRDASVVDSFAQASTDVIAAVDSIQFGVQRLIQKGARNILISNVPDISKIPETAERALSDPGLFSRAAQLSLDFNLRLNQRIPNLAATPGVKIMLFDFHTRFDQLISHPALYGFTNTNQACFNYDNYQFHPQCNFEKFVFFDSIHPTAKTHSLLGQEMIRVVNSGAKAIPAVLLLLLD